MQTLLQESKFAIFHCGTKTTANKSIAIAGLDGRAIGSYYQQ
jgi:hypothetical protein